MTEVRKEDLELATKELEKVLKQDYGATFADVTSDSRRKTQRITHAVGVLLKKDYSRLETRRSRNAPGGMERKWVVDPALVKTMPATSWQMQVLKHAPQRKPGERPAQLAMRLKRETLLGKAFRDTLHDFICEKPEVRQKVEQALADAGFGAYVGLVMPRSLIAKSGLPIAAILAPYLTAFPAMAVAIAVVVLGTLGLSALCRGSRNPKTRRGRS